MRLSKIRPRTFKRLVRNRIQRRLTVLTRLDGTIEEDMLGGIHSHDANIGPLDSSLFDHPQCSLTRLCQHSIRQHASTDILNQCNVIGAFLLQRLQDHFGLFYAGVLSECLPGCRNDSDSGNQDGSAECRTSH